MKNLAMPKTSPMNIGIFALVVVLVAWFFGNRTGKGKSVAGASLQLDKEIKENPLTYELSSYKQWADRVHSSMVNFFDNEKAINSVFTKMRNRSDVLQLVKSFGNRKHLLWNVGNGSMGSWFSVKLSEKDIAEINEILSRNNIDFQF